MNLRTYKIILKYYFKNRKFNLSLVEDNINILKLFKNFFRGLKNHINRSITNEILQLGVKYEAQKIIDQFNWIDIPKQSQLISNTEVALKKNHIADKIIIPIYELSDGKSYSYVSNKLNLKTFAIQHGSQGPWAYFKMHSYNKIMAQIK